MSRPPSRCASPLVATRWGRKSSYAREARTARPIRSPMTATRSRLRCGSARPSRCTSGPCPGIVRVRYGRVTNVNAINASTVAGPTVHRPGGDGSPPWLASHSTDQWELTVSPAPNRPKVTLTISKHECNRSGAICSTATYKQQRVRYHKPLTESTRITVLYEDPDPDPPAPPPGPPGPVRAVRSYGNHAGWQAPASHGGALITAYRLFAGGCDGFHARTLRHPDDFWHHVGHDGRYHVSKGWRGAVGVQAVNEHGAGPCVES